MVVTLSQKGCCKNQYLGGLSGPSARVVAVSRPPPCRGIEDRIERLLVANSTIPFVFTNFGKPVLAAYL